MATKATYIEQMQHDPDPLSLLCGDVPDAVAVGLVLLGESGGAEEAGGARKVEAAFRLR